MLEAFVRTAEPKDKPISSRYACLKAHKELHALGKTDTPYGTLAERGVVEGYVDNARVDMAIAYINPFALLYLACDRSLQFVALLKKAVARSPTGKFRLAYYIDETTPGNVHSWDHVVRPNALMDEPRLALLVPVTGCWVVNILLRPRQRYGRAWRQPIGVDPFHV